MSRVVLLTDLQSDVAARLINGLTVKGGNDVKYNDCAEIGKLCSICDAEQLVSIDDLNQLVCVTDGVDTEKLAAAYRILRSTSTCAKLLVICTSRADLSVALKGIVHKYNSSIEAELSHVKHVRLAMSGFETQIRQWASIFWLRSRQSDATAAEERINQLEYWLNKPICVDVINIDPDSDQEIADSVERICKESDEIRFICEETSIPTHLIELSQLSVKPPNVHWPPVARSDELQITLRFSFPSCPLPLRTFSKWMSQFELLASEPDQTYKWTHGILIVEELVKVSISYPNSGLSLVEFSVRVDPDEVVSEDSFSDINPVLLAWTVFAPFVLSTVRELGRWPDYPYQVHIVPYGNRFYPDQVVPIMKIYSLHDLLASNGHQLASGNTDDARAADIHKCFAENKFTTFGELVTWLKTISNDDNLRRKSSTKSLLSLRVPTETVQQDTSFNSPEEGNNTHHGSAGPAVNRMRALGNRRVSFGVISVQGMRTTRAIEDSHAGILLFVTQMVQSCFDDLFEQEVIDL